MVPRAEQRSGRASWTARAPCPQQRALEGTLRLGALRAVNRAAPGPGCSLGLHGAQRQWWAVGEHPGGGQGPGEICRGSQWEEAEGVGVDSVGHPMPFPIAPRGRKTCWDLNCLSAGRSQQKLTHSPSDSSNQTSWRKANLTCKMAIDNLEKAELLQGGDPLRQR